MARGYLTPWRGGSLASTGYGGGGSIFDLHRQMNRLFDDLFETRQGHGGALAGATLAAPAMDVHQDDKQIEITAELPGVNEQDIDLSVEDGVLTLSGEKKSERKDEQSGYSERSYGRFERRITLPSNVDEDNCSADFKDGVLRITIPKSEEKQRAKRIPLGAKDRQIEQRPKAQNDRETQPKQQAAEKSRHKHENERQPS